MIPFRSRHAWAGLLFVAVPLLSMQVILPGRALAEPLRVDEPISNWPAGEVAIELWGGMVDGAWELEAAEPFQTYTTRALALTATPKQYDAQGILTNRPNPHLLRAKTRQEFAAGTYRMILRSKNAARLYVDGRLVLETGFMPRNSSGHEPVPPLKEPLIEGMHPLPANYQEEECQLELEEGSHGFLVETIIGGKGLRAELGELVVAYQVATESEDESSFVVVGPPQSAFPLTETRWNAWCLEEAEELQRLEQVVRRDASAAEDAYWAERHRRTREFLMAESTESERLAPTNMEGAAVINHWIDQAGADSQREIPGKLGDHAFLRRLALDVIGIPPTMGELKQFLEDPPETRRRLAVDRYLEHPRWADPWVAYWQDVLAENPGILKPELNNTGPFRWWIYESFLDNKPLDRFATELAMMKGSVYEGGPAAFSLATQNDVPMAAKAHVLSQAFLGIEMNCARCHDAPYHPYLQQDLFQLAAMLNRETLKLPESSTVPVLPGGRIPAVEMSLSPGDAIVAAWPFEDLSQELPDWILRDSSDPREEFAARLTSPFNTRFAEVLANRIWQRYLGWGIVPSADDWYLEEPTHPELLQWLAHELILNGYDAKHLARLILNSEIYQRKAQNPSDNVRGRLRVTPERRRLKAEQVVDSLFAVNGKPFDSEPLTLDQEGRRPASSFLNLGIPQRSWQFTSLSNERDRPALALPVAQGVTDVLLAFGWRDSRPHPLTNRDHTPTVLQPLVLANGMAVNRIIRLSADSEFTRLSLQETELESLIEELYLTILTRPPEPVETVRFVELLGEGFDARRRDATDYDSGLRRRLRSAVSWSNHLSAEATEIKMELERMAREGEPATQRLAADWRERMEDAVWSLVTSPEFVFVP